jgi:hypothetical protein
MDQFMTTGLARAQSSPNKIVSRAYAERMAKTIFTRYPNPKAGPEYLVELVNTLAEQPQWIVDRVADRHLGITFRFKTFAPSIGEVLEFIASLKDMRDRYNHYSEVQKRVVPRLPFERKPFRPYPKLWEAFADDPEVLARLDDPNAFDFLTEASKRLTMRGKDVARKFIVPEESAPT